MTHIKQFLLTMLFALASSTTMSAYDFSAKNAEGVTLYYNILPNGSCEVTYQSYNSICNMGNGDYIGTIVIPSSVEYNGVTYSITTIGASAFENSGVHSIEIPGSVTTIDYSAFSDCEFLSSINLPSSLTKIESGAFFGCNTLSSINLPPSITTIEGWTFSGCISLSSINLPLSITKIGVGAFDDCGLQSIEIPNSVMTIDNGAFSGCWCLSSIILPSSVTSIGRNAFSSCSHLLDVYVAWTTPVNMVFDNVFDNVHLKTLHVPIGCTDNYKTRSPWNDFKEIVEYAPGGNEGNDKCATPTVEMVDGELVFCSATPGAKYYYTIDCDDVAALTSSETGRVAIAPAYRVRVYAYADGYDNSDTVEKVFPLGECKEVEKEVIVYVYDSNEATDIALETGETIKLYLSKGKAMIVDAPMGSVISVYSNTGAVVKTLTVNDVATTIELPTDSIYIIKVGTKVFKVKV